MTLIILYVYALHGLQMVTISIADACLWMSRRLTNHARRCLGAMQAP